MAITIHERDVTDFNEKLISDSVCEINRNTTKDVWCFTLEQAQEIRRRCRFKTIMRESNGIFYIRRTEKYYRKSKKKLEEDCDEND